MKFTLKAARVNKGLTQVAAAKLLNISKSALQKYEAGTVQPTVPVVKKIEAVYGVPFANLIFLNIKST